MGGGPAPQLAGNTASLGSQSQSNLWLCFPCVIFVCVEPPDSKQMFLLFPAAESSGGHCSRVRLPPPQSKQWS